MAEGAGIPLVQLTELPYLFNNTKEADIILDGVLWEPVNKALKDNGFVMAIWAENGFRSFGANGPITSPADLAAFKMRSQETPMHINMYDSLGGNPVTKPTSEVSAALSTGIVDGFDNAPLFTLAGGWFKHVSHYSLTEHIYQPAVVAYSKAAWDKLPPDLQTTVLGDPKAEAAKGRKAVRAENKASVDVMKEMGVTIVTLTPEQKKAFSDKTIDVHKQFLKDNPSTLTHYKAVQAKLQSMRPWWKASSKLMPKSVRNEVSCRTADIILRPPDAPRPNMRPRSTPITGQMLVRQRLSGAKELGLPGSGSNQRMPLFINSPLSGSITLDPKMDSKVWVTTTKLPHLSTTEKLVVQVCARAPSTSPMVPSRASWASRMARAS